VTPTPAATRGEQVLRAGAALHDARREAGARELVVVEAVPRGPRPPRGEHPRLVGERRQVELGAAGQRVAGGQHRRHRLGEHDLGGEVVDLGRARLDAYADTAGATRAGLDAIAGNQPGDP
jgi:hypothetical protein